MTGSLIGGIGLFMLGMWLMTHGMKTAAGPAMKAILTKATRTRARALASGMVLTAVVQSSSAVTVAAIGFVNAGLLTLGQALWVLFGANVGTTMTGWLVAVAGMGVKIETAALPLVGIGMLLHLAGRTPRQAAAGLTLAGFGVLFLGIDTLKQGFLGLASQYAPPTASGVSGIVLHVVAGLILTVLMQSSSAALAVALTAAQGGLLPFEPAAAVVIGANLGTTATALIAAAGATVNARRAALAHVLFNLLTAVVALLILPWLLQGVMLLGRILAMEPGPGTSLALFHTMFNVLGVVLMWPASGRLTAFLHARFRSDEEDLARPRHLDANSGTMPELAVPALVRELARMGALAVALLRDAMAGHRLESLARHADAIDALKGEIGSFVGQLQRGALAADASRRLAALLRVLRYHASAAQLARAIAETGAWTGARPATADTAGQPVRHWLQRADRLCALLLADGAPDLQAREQALREVEDHYQALKVELLQGGAAGALDLDTMEAQLQSASLARRALQQAVKAARIQDRPDAEPAAPVDALDTAGSARGSR